MSPFFDHQFTIYRSDQNHPTVSGNKLYKLAPNIAHAKALGCTSILSFGGAYSNHLHALAWASQESGLNCIGGVRGELKTELTPTLIDCQRWGMQLKPIPRTIFRDIRRVLASSGGGRYQKIKHALPQLPFHIEDDTFIIPEGGSNRAAIDSLAKSYKAVFAQPEFSTLTHAVCATGTGATVAGLYKAAPSHITVIGVQAVAEQDATLKRIQSWLNTDCSKLNPDLKIIEGHLGGFAKTTKGLLNFITKFEAEYKIPLDPVYNGKVAYKLHAMAEQGFFGIHDRVLMIHTGGLQGKRGFSVSA